MFRLPGLIFIFKSMICKTMHPNLQKQCLNYRQFSLRSMHLLFIFYSCLDYHDDQNAKSNWLPFDINSNQIEIEFQFGVQQGVNSPNKVFSDYITPLELMVKVVDL